MFLLHVANSNSYAQAVLEMQRQTNVGSSNYGFGLSTNPVVTQFRLDAVNNNTFSANVPISTFTVSLANQQFTGLNYGRADYYADGSNFNTLQTTGLVFGAEPSLASGAFPTDNVQGAAPFNRYDNLGFYLNGNGAPKNTMFTSGATASFGIDVENINANKLNGGVFLFTTAEVLFADTIAHPKGSRAYFGDVVIKFSQPVLNPIINFAGLGGSYRFVPFGTPLPYNVISKFRSTFFTTELELASTGYTTTKLSGNANFGLSISNPNNIVNNNHANPNGGSTFDAGEFPDSYGAASGSVRINGVVTQLVYRVYLQGGTSSDFAWSAKGLDVNGNPLITDAIKNPFTGDIWAISASYEKPTQQISGNVFIDKDGLTDNNVNQSAGIANPTTNIGGSLFANLLNTAGQVVASIPVGNNGAYLFDNVPAGTYSVQLTTNASSGTYFSPAAAPATVLPPTWANTGEFVGNTAGNDGSANGKSSSVVVNALDIKTEVNFGIERLPESNNYTNFIDRPTLNQVITLVDSLPVLSGSDYEDQPINGSLATKAIRIDNLPNNAILLYAGVQVFAGQVITNYTPSLLQVKFTMPNAGFTGVVIFNYSYIDAAGLADPTPAFYSLQWPAGNALPIVLSDFAVVKNNCNAILNWKTSSELNSDKFEIQYSTTTNTNFEALGAIAASGNSTSTKGYQFNFSMESGVFYYFRLKMYKKDGTFTYSEIRSLSCLDSKSEIEIRPNPAVNSFHIEKMAKGKNTVSIYSNDGKLLKTLSVVNNQIIDISDLASGGYVLRILNENGIASVEKLVKY